MTESSKLLERVAGARERLAAAVKHEIEGLFMMAAQDSAVVPEGQVSEKQIRRLMERISAARTKLLALVPFFGHLCLTLKPRIAKPGDGVPTAGVAKDGTLVLNYAYCMGDGTPQNPGLTDAELCGLLCHEVLHPALHCWMRQGTRSAIVTGPDGSRFSLWNLAHDLSFNPMILEMGNDDVALPEGAAHDPSYKSQAAEEIYDAELKKAQSNPDGQPGSSGSITMKGMGGHSIGNDMRDDLADTPDGKKAARGEKSASRKLEEDWKEALVAAAQVHEKEKGQGTLPAGLQKIIDELKDPKVDWRDQLSMWVGENGIDQDYSYRRPSRRSESVGEYMPSLQKDGVDDLVILWDTSGSMNGRETAILTEVQAMCEDLGLSVRVVICDAAVHADVDGIEDALEIIPHIKGGGGSDFRPAFNLLEDDGFEGSIIAFTDGYISVPKLKPQNMGNILWVVGPNDQDPTRGRWGSVLKIDDLYEHENW